MGPHSIDLRQRVVQAVDNKEGSLRQLADRFFVSVSFITRLLSLRRRTGSLTPRPHGGGRKLTEDVSPGIIADLERLLEDEVAGDPMTKTVWVRSSTKTLRNRLRDLGYQVSHKVVWRLLRKLKFSLRYNKKRRAGAQSPERDEQFKHIASQKRVFSDAGLPIISVDTKKKELIGEFRNNGRAWCKEPHEVNDHDFTSMAECRAVPFGIYDLTRNRGYVSVGISNDTPEFAVNAIARWWEQEGRLAYPHAGKLLILADCGGTNGYRFRAWKLNLQVKLCDAFGLTVTVCHYPPGCSKWNPVERRLFSEISKNWAGRPLRTLSIMLGYIRGTTTTTGLKVEAYLDENVYRKGQKVSREDMARLSLAPHTICRTWNYTLSPSVGEHLGEARSTS
jgi:transposase